MDELLALSRYTYYFGERVRQINGDRLPARLPSCLKTPGTTAWHGLCSVINGSVIDRQRGHKDLSLSMAAGQVVVNAVVGDIHEFTRLRVAGDESGAQEVRARGAARTIGDTPRVLVADHVHGVVLEDGGLTVKWIVESAGNQTEDGLLPMAFVASPQELNDMGFNYTMDRIIFPNFDDFLTKGEPQDLTRRMFHLNRQLRGDIIPRDDASEHFTTTLT